MILQYFGGHFEKRPLPGHRNLRYFGTPSKFSTYYPRNYHNKFGAFVRPVPIIFLCYLTNIRRLLYNQLRGRNNLPLCVQKKSRLYTKLSGKRIMINIVYRSKIIFPVYSVSQKIKYPKCLIFWQSHTKIL